MIQTKEREKLGTLLALIFKLQDETSFPDQKQRQEALNKLALYSEERGFNLDPNNLDLFLQGLLIRILEESTKPTKLPEGNLPPPELTKIYEEEKAKKEAQIQKAISSKKAYGDYRNYIDLFEEWVHKRNSKLPKELARAIAEKSAQKAVASFDPIARPNVATKEDENKILDQVETIIEEELKKVEFETKTVIQEAEEIVGKEAEKIKKEQEAVINEIKKNIKTESIKIAAQPTIIEAAKGETLPPKEETLAPKELPPEIIQKLNQPPEEVSFLPLYTVLHPKIAAAFIEKAIYTVPAKFLSLTAEDASLEWQTMMQKGLFVEDIQASIKTLKAMGVPETHPLLKRLSDKVASLQEQQKFTIQTKDGQIIYKDTLAARIFKHYRHFGKITGRQKIYDEDLKTNLPRLSPDFAWSQGGYAGFLRNTLNRFRFVINTYERISKFVTKGKYTSFLTPVRQFFSQKVTQPIIRWLAKTAAGKAVKAGAKKAAGWLATKAGIKLGIWAAGAAAAAPSAGVSLLIAAAVEIGTRLLGKIWDKIKTIIRDPEKAFMAIGAGILALVFIPMPFALIAILPLTIGGLGLITFIAAPATLGAIGGGISGFFIAIAAIPIAAPIALFVIILFSVLAILTLFIVLVVSGAFILPGKMAEVTPTQISPYESDFFSISKSVSETKFENYEIENPQKITYSISIRPKNNYVLKGPHLVEDINISKEGQAPSLEPCQFTDEEVKEAISSGKSLNCERIIDSRFKNSAITNIVTLTTSVDGQIGTHKAIASATVIIGKPPGDCPPFGWPTGGQITQGPEGATSHKRNNEEAIDIANGRGTPIYATHNGEARIFEQNPTGRGAGYAVEISGVCNGKPFYTEYYHMKDAGRVSGKITKGQIIGFMSNSGAQGVHLHYEFRPKRNNGGPPFKMEFNAIPSNLLFRSCNSSSQCNTMAVY